MIEWEDDFTGVDEAQLKGDKTDPGWYFATLEKCEVEDKTAAILLSLRITGPLFKGNLEVLKLGNPTYEPDPAKQQTLRNRARSIASRLGIIKKEDLGKPGKISWTKAIGWKGVLEMEAHEFEGKQGQTIHMARTTYLPVYPLDHEKIPPHVREVLGLPLLPGQVSPAGAAAGGKSSKASKAAAAAASPNPGSTPPRPMIEPGEV